MFKEAAQYIVSVLSSQCVRMQYLHYVWCPVRIIVDWLQSLLIE